MNCSDLCVKKHTQLNFKVMSVFVEIQPKIVQKRLEEMNKAQLVAEEQASKSPTETVVTSLETSKESSAAES